jgi:hypothetical protein
LQLQPSIVEKQDFLKAHAINRLNKSQGNFYCSILDKDVCQQNPFVFSKNSSEKAYIRQQLFDVGNNKLVFEKILAP